MEIQKNISQGKSVKPGITDIFGIFSVDSKKIRMK